TSAAAPTSTRASPCSASSRQACRARTACSRTCSRSANGRRSEPHTGRAMSETPTNPPAPEAPAAPEQDRRRLRRIALRVVIVQVLTLLVLWLLQARYHGTP